MNTITSDNYNFINSLNLKDKFIILTSVNCNNQSVSRLYYYLTT